jgi:hydroxymethylpyrimidine pyrophosphatase-like HAD family hydrolase
MGFGDYMNDYEMLKVCGESYAMANACEGIANLAKHTTLSNDEDGVMAVLRTM